MVLESIIDPFVAKKHPVWLFFVGFIFVVFSLFFSLWVFKEQAGMVMVFLTVILSIPLMYSTLEQEEEEDWNNNDEGKILKEHSKAIVFLSSMFLGFVFAFTLLYIFLPVDVVQNVFKVQMDTINAINGSPAVGNAFDTDTFILIKILTNNLKVMLFSIFFALFFGAGAIFILAWNASVIATAIGNYVRNEIALSVSTMGLAMTGSYFQFISLGIMRYMTHGIFEIVGYFIGALAGGIISIGVVRHGLNSDRFKNLLYDSLVLVLIASIFLIFGAIVEIYVTPRLF